VPGDSLKPPSPQDAAADSVIRVLRALPGYVPTEYTGKEAKYQTETGVLRLQGAAQVDREGDQLAADTIEYRQKSQLVKAMGNPRVKGEQQDLKGDLLFYDLTHKRATVRGARTTLTESGTWYVTGDFSTEGTERIYATTGEFTTCDLPEPHYHFSAGKVKVVKGKYIVGGPTTVYFGKVPVMALPFIVQSLEKGRRSGILVPRFSITDLVRTRQDFHRQIDQLGYYWAINDYLGAQVTTSWRGGSPGGYTALDGRLDYNWKRQFLNGGFQARQYWPDFGPRTFTLNGNSSWRPDERTNIGVSANFATSSEFIRDISVDPQEVTQDLNSTVNLSRRLDWGTLALGFARRQSVSDGAVEMTFPSFSLQPKSVTLFRSPTPEQSRWYNNATLTWNLTGKRFSRTPGTSVARQFQPVDRTQISGGLGSFSLGKLSLSATGDLDQQVFRPYEQKDTAGTVIRTLPGGHQDVGQWNASLSYQQDLIGQTSLSPNLSVSQEIRRDSLSHDEYLQGPTRLSFGAGLSTALFGFYPGFGPFSSIRHRISPTLSYAYSPEVQQTELQERVFGEFGGSTQNRITLSFNQTWEAKLKETQKKSPADSARATGGDSARAEQATPSEPQKVTILSITTSSLTYDFNRAARGESGFTTTTLSNNLSSDYLHGFSVQIQHELFDASDLDPNQPENRGRNGKFSPRLSQLSTGFELGPSSAIFRWLGFGPAATTAVQGTSGTGGAEPGPEPSGRVVPPGSSGFTGNPQGTGGGPWRLGIQYSFNRPRRTFRSLATAGDDVFGDRGLGYDPTRATQTAGLDLAFSLTPNWAVTWNTTYSITDGDFSGHRLNFKRDLHRWQANFSFYQTPHGNTGFQFYVELIDNPDLKVDYRESNLGIDQRR
jgi:hypothetical protein